MISLQLQKLLGAGKGLVIAPKYFYSSGVKRQHGPADDGQDSVHLPNNVEELDAGQKALFSPERTRDISGPNIDSHFQGANINLGEGKHQAGEDAHVAAYACSGSGIHLNSVMQPNVPLPFESVSHHGKSSEVGDHSSGYVDNPPEGGHWTGGEKYLAEDRKNVHERGGGRGGIGSKPGTTPLAGHGKSLNAFMIGSIPMTSCCGIATPPINQVLMWRHGNVLVSHWAFGTRSLLPLKSNPHLTYSTSMNNDNINVAPLSQKDKLKKTVKDYGATVIVFHVGISLLSLGGFYLAVSSGLNVMDILDKFGLGGKTAAKEASTFAMAYIVHKAFAPVRISITLGATPFIVRYLRRVGFLKPPK